MKWLRWQCFYLEIAIYPAYWLLPANILKYTMASKSTSIHLKNNNERQNICIYDVWQKCTFSGTGDILFKYHATHQIYTGCVYFLGKYQIRPMNQIYSNTFCLKKSMRQLKPNASPLASSMCLFINYQWQSKHFKLSVNFVIFLYCNQVILPHSLHLTLT